MAESVSFTIYHTTLDINLSQFHNLNVNYCSKYVHMHISGVIIFTNVPKYDILWEISAGVVEVT